MRRVRLFRTTPFRLALLVSGLVAASFIATGTIAYRLISGETVRVQQDRIGSILSILETQARFDGPDRLLTTVTALTEARVRSAPLIEVRDSTGTIVAGSVLPLDPALGWSRLRYAPGGEDEKHEYLTYRGMIGPYAIMIAVDDTEVIDLNRSILWALAWSSLAAIIVAIIGGQYVGRRVRERQQVFEATLDRVGQGDLSARVPLSVADDDVDQLSRGVNQALDRLSHVVEGMRQVSNDIAHDLRTPLGRLKMTILEAQDKADRGEVAQAELAQAIDTCDAISHTFAALLRIAQIEGGARRERFAPVDLGGLLTDIGDIYAGVAEDAGQSLTVTAPQATIPGDRDLLAQALVNLIENAIHHCPAGTRITGTVEKVGNRVDLTIQDTGPGVPEAERDKVILRLYRLEKSRTTPGSGLGLSLVKAIADLHDATLTLEDAAPGLRVRLSFPPPVGT